MKKHDNPDMLDPDVRFLLANERTLLAWVRTALALLAGGIALTRFGDTNTTTSVIGIIAISLGALMTVIGLTRFKSADRAIRSGSLPSAGNGPQLQVYVVVIFAAALAVIELVNIA